MLVVQTGRPGRLGGGGGRSKDRGRRRAQSGGSVRLTFDEDLGPRVGDAVLVARLAHVLGLVVDRDRVNDQSTDAVAVLEPDVSARRDPLSILK